MARLSPRVERFLNGKHIGSIATSMRDGSPHLTPIWYMLEDGKLVINTTTGRVKYHNIERDNRVCLLVEDGYSHVIVFGSARIAKERDGKEDIETLAIRYTGEEQGRKSARNTYWKQPRVTIEITPERVIDAL